MKTFVLLLSWLTVVFTPTLVVADDSTSADTNQTVVDSQSGDEILKLDWLDLIPESERNMFNNMGMPVIDHDGGAAAQTAVGSIRQELNGSQVKLPGFVIPLEGTADLVTEFLLVPFLGACIHVPPPPANQIVYVRFKEGAPVTQLWDVVYIVGTLKTETVFSDEYAAEAGYVIEGISLEDYDDY